MTVQCALYMGALKVFERAFIYYVYHVVLVNKSEYIYIGNVKCVALAVPDMIAIGVLVEGCEP